MLTDAVIVGGGFYGVMIARYLARKRGVKRITLIEAESSLLARASFSNQARVHNGYHYPRSFTTAYRSRVNLPRFAADFPDAVRADFTKVYAIARRQSKVSARQFERFCQKIGAELAPVDEAVWDLFDPRLIERAYVVREYAFDARALADWATRELDELGVTVRLGTSVTGVTTRDGGVVVATQDARGAADEVTAAYLFNCTYSGLNHLPGLGRSAAGLKHELTEMALVEVPPEFAKLGVTVMDGPFFSVMPFPARGLHSLSHVRYTPHLGWRDEVDVNPYARLDQYDRHSRFDRMLRDTSRYLPRMAGARYVESLFEIKTVLEKNEADDGRPILFHRHADPPRCYSVLGGKIDNIYDVLEKLDGLSLGR